MEQWDEILGQLADSPEEYVRERSNAQLVRRGEDHFLRFKTIPNLGLCVCEDEYKNGEPIPVDSYVQGRLLGLPRLATQLIKSIDKLSNKRPVPYIEGSCQFVSEDHPLIWNQPSQEFRRYLNEPDVGSTKLVQLMAGAGQGKTILLQHTAREAARSYQAAASPTPLLLPVDLLGRYVGTIDDAIAGTLNNNYSFPLTQRDVVLAVTRGWIVLALDGFDELVARVGARDAFTRITELLDQLRGSGTVILSARESFFELYQITNAIKSYLKPRTGSYTTSTMKLLQWDEEHAVRVFMAVEIESPERQLTLLLEKFKSTRALVLQPFFLTRLASLWKKGERFETARANAGELERTQFLIESYIERETNEKWVDGHGQPLLSGGYHTILLSGLAEEMWISGAFKLMLDELRTSTKLTLEDAKLQSITIAGVVERVPTHAALAEQNKTYTFIHDQVFAYYLANQIVKHIKSMNTSAIPLEMVLRARELGPDISKWVVWLLEAAGDINSHVDYLLKINSNNEDLNLRNNCSSIIALLLPRYDGHLTLRNMSFISLSLKSRAVLNKKFINCELHGLDVSDSQLKDVQFQECHISGLIVNQNTVFENTSFEKTNPVSIQVVPPDYIFSPEKIDQELIVRGAILSAKQSREPQYELDGEMEDCISYVSRLADRMTHLNIESIYEKFPKMGKVFVKVAMQTDVIESVKKQTAGSHKTFFRFLVDRKMLLESRDGKAGVKAIDNFWKYMTENHMQRTSD